jgi:hypothetical protein
MERAGSSSSSLGWQDGGLQRYSGEDAFPQEKVTGSMPSTVRPTISVVSADGRTLELDDDEALALAIERSLAGDDYFGSVPQSQMDHEPEEQECGPLSPELEPSVSIPSSAATSRSSTRLPSATDGLSDASHPTQPLAGSANPSRRVNFEADTSTSLPSIIHVPASPHAFQITGPSFNHLLKDLIAQANVRLEPCPTAFESSQCDDPTFVLICTVKAYRPAANSEDEEQDTTKPPIRTLLNLQSMELTPELKAKVTRAPSPSGIVVLKEEERGRIDFNLDLFLPLTLQVLVERLHHLLEVGRRDAKRTTANDPLTPEQLAGRSLFQFVALHPGPPTGDNVSRKATKKQRKVAAAAAAIRSSSPPRQSAGDETELTGQEKRMGKRHKVHKITSKVIGAMQVNRQLSHNDEREEWITPFPVENSEVSTDGRP